MKELYAISHEYYQNTSLIINLGRNGIIWMSVSFIFIILLIAGFMLYLAGAPPKQSFDYEFLTSNTIIHFILVVVIPELGAISSFTFALDLAKKNVLARISGSEKQVAPDELDQAIDEEKYKYLREVVKPIGESIEDALPTIRNIRSAYSDYSYASRERKFEVVSSSLFEATSKPRIMALLIYLLSLIGLSIIVKYVETEQLRDIMTDLLNPSAWPKYFVFVLLCSVFITVLSIPFRWWGSLVWNHFILYRVGKESAELNYLISQLAYYAFYNSERYRNIHVRSRSVRARINRLLHRLFDARN